MRNFLRKEEWVNQIYVKDVFSNRELSRGIIYNLLNHSLFINHKTGIILTSASNKETWHTLYIYVFNCVFLNFEKLYIPVEYGLYERGGKIKPR